jgi:hypothetical protein
MGNVLNAFRLRDTSLHWQAMREEYKAIADAGFNLQLDDREFRLDKCTGSLLGSSVQGEGSLQRNEPAMDITRFSMPCLADELLHRVGGRSI